MLNFVSTKIASGAHLPLTNVLKCWNGTRSRGEERNIRMATTMVMEVEETMVEEVVVEVAVATDAM